MEIKKINELIKLVEKSSNIAELSIEEKGFKFSVKLVHGMTISSYNTVDPEKSIVVDRPHSMAISSPPIPSKPVKHIVSPIVGTFYSKASPTSRPYVKIGDVVNPKTIICIIESMKVFNEIEAEQSGTIVEILLQDGTPVEHGQPLYTIE